MSENGSPPVPLEIDARLMEEAVVLAMRDRMAAPYWKEREEIYAVEDAESRERRFVLLNRRTFGELRLGDPIHVVLEERSDLVDRVARCRVIVAPSAKKEGAELFVTRNAGSGERAATGTILLRLRPPAFLEPERLLDLLRHEFYHIADMVDPAFGYDPALPDLDGGPGHLQLVLDRYRVLWDATIDGRLWRSGRSSGAVRNQRRREFIQSFPSLGDRAGEFFTLWFEKNRPRHEDLLEFARNPVAAGSVQDRAKETSSQCPLCKCLAQLERRAPCAANLLEEIRRDFPSWCPEDGICPQCRELYLQRPLSRDAAAVLPRI